MELVLFKYVTSLKDDLLPGRVAVGWQVPPPLRLSGLWQLRQQRQPLRPLVFFPLPCWATKSEKLFKLISGKNVKSMTKKLSPFAITKAGCVWRGISYPWVGKLWTSFKKGFNENYLSFNGENSMFAPLENYAWKLFFVKLAILSSKVEPCLH